MYATLKKQGKEKVKHNLYTCCHNMVGQQKGDAIRHAYNRNVTRLSRAACHQANINLKKKKDYAYAIHKSNSWDESA